MYLHLVYSYITWLLHDILQNREIYVEVTAK